MTANPAILQRLLWDIEGTGLSTDWAENVTSMSGAMALPLVAPAEVNVNQPMIETGRAVQYRNQGTLCAPGPFDITFSYKLFLPGHGSTMVGSPSVSDLETHLGWVFGGGPTLTAAASDTISGGGSTATSLATTGANGFTAGGLFHVGTKGDAGADGQGGVVNAHAANALTTRVAFPAAPANSAAVLPATNVYTVEDATSSSIAGYRFQLFTANTQWLIHGGFPTGARLEGFNPGEFPTITVSGSGSWAEPRASTFPDTTSMATHLPAPVAAGSLNVQTFGTTTRNAISYRKLAVDFTLGVAPLIGPDGVNPYQTIVGAKRTVDKCTISITVDAGAASTTPTYWTAWLTNSWHHILWTGSTADGQSMMFYAPRCKYIGMRPTQTIDGPLNAVVLQFEAHTNDQVTTSALTLSAFRLGFA